MLVCKSNDEIQAVKTFILREKQLVQSNDKIQAIKKFILGKNNWYHREEIQTLRTKYQEHQDPDIFRLIFHIFPELLQVLPLHFWQQYNLPHIFFQRCTRLVSDGPTTIVYLYTNLLYLLTNYYISAAARKIMSRNKIVAKSIAKFISKGE